MNKLKLAVLVAMVAQLVPMGSLSASVSSEKQPYTIALPSISDRSLVGQKVDVYVRRLTYNEETDLKLVLANVELVSAPQDRREATLTLDEKEIRRIQKYEKPGQDLVVRSRESNN